MIVVGGGNAALSAAMAARHAAERVLMLERAPEHMRGGNSRHTRNIRCAHAAADEFFSAPYSEEELLEDLIGVTGGPNNLDLAKYAIRQSSKMPAWMTEHGAAWQQPLAGTLSLGRTNRWFLGGGKALLNSYYRTAQKMGICIRYDAMVEDLTIENGRFEGVMLKSNGTQEMIRGRAVVLAAGGYEANIEWLKRHWGEAAENFIVRGTPYNDGTILAALLKKGAKPIGDPKGFHAIAVDARAPKFDGGIVTRLDAIPFGVVVNKLGKRFYDEGEAIWPKRYAIWGGLIAAQPDQIAYAIVDSKTINRFLPPMFKPYQADSLDVLAAAMNVDPRAFAETIACLQRAPLRGSSSRNWNPPTETARAGSLLRRAIGPFRSTARPFTRCRCAPAITFTYMGVAVDDACRVLDQSGRAFENVYAAGEIMSGNILTKGYLAGFGMTIGSVFGELAGRMAATNGRARA